MSNLTLGLRVSPHLSNTLIAYSRGLLNGELEYFIITYNANDSLPVCNRLILVLLRGSHTRDIMGALSLSLIKNELSSPLEKKGL